jgi:hypothetical protein
MEYGYYVDKAGGWNQDDLDYAVQNDYVEKMIRLLKESRCNGSFVWWWPPSNAVTDFGMIESYGAARPALATLSAAIPGMQHNEPWTAPLREITIDRDLDPRGMPMVIQNARAELLDLDHQGYRVELRSAGSGRTTEDMELAGLGGAPIAAGGPPRYVNAEFDRVEIALKGGSWLEVDRDGVLDAEQVVYPVHLRVQARNTDDVTWSATAGAPGEVTLQITQAGEIQKVVAVGQPVAWGETRALEFSLGRSPHTGPFSLRFTSDRTGGFGETFRFDLDGLMTNEVAQDWKAYR